MTHLTESQRLTIARSFARPDLVIRGPEDGLYRLDDATSLQPVIGLESDEYRVTLSQIEQHLGI
ncbi:hypothetical protein [Microbacterium sp. VKM Ac-2923]|uniref:hypothetical protein n=1 Tax=Microbacterium sp. VKM Ac-2923 TaxID=2929476 RepID=UPI001FB2C3C3|nr:hypothetical protein [Microbacterium sp. VKM Ac-2923]MCJ1707424.1 hypothetical protein [Microbacterium sp. VKM Ac-2923]